MLSLELLLLTAATSIACAFSRREYFLLSGLCLISIALWLYVQNMRREQSLLNLPGIYALGLLGGEGVACFHLSRLGTVWSRDTWLSFYLAYLFFYLFYVLIGEGGRKGSASASHQGEQKREVTKDSQISLLGFIMLFLLIISTAGFLLEAVRLRFIPFFTVDTPHAYSTFHLPGIHYFTTLVVLIPSVSVLYLAERIERRGERISGEFNLKSVLWKAVDVLSILGFLLPWILTILMVSRFQFLFSIILMLFTAYLRGFRMRKWQIAAVFLGMLVIYIILTVERAHSISYLNGIFEMKSENTPIFITQPYMYIANNFDNFNVMTEELVTHSKGMRMLYPFVTLSGLKYFVDLPLAYPLYVTKEELTTLTLLYDAWYDFGIAGVVGFSMLLGAVSGVFYRKKGELRNPFAILMLAQLSFYLLFSFFTTWFSNPASWFYFGFSLIFYIMNEKLKNN